MFSFLLFVGAVALVVWLVKKSKRRVSDYVVPPVDGDVSPEPTDWGSSSYTSSAPTRTAYKSRASTSRSSRSSSSSSRPSGGGFGGGRSGGGGSSSGW
jgi:uncharacterized membrane protein YgcG